MGSNIHFYDSANPAAIPSGVYAAVYINGFAWSPSQIRRMHKVFAISVHDDITAAHHARCIDVENGATTPDHVVPFLRLRRSLGFNDGTVYVNRSNHDMVERLCIDAGLRPFFWVATLDGTQDVPGAWAVQYQGGEHAAFDLSVLHGVDNFHRP